jgi:hypothetical protein
MSLHQIIQDALRAQGVNAEVSDPADRKFGPIVAVERTRVLKATSGNVTVEILAGEDREVAEVSILTADNEDSFTLAGEEATAFLGIMTVVMKQLRSDAE